VKGSGSLDRSVLRGLLALERDRERASPFFRELQDGKRRWEELTGEERTLLQGGPLIDLALERSFALRYDDPAEMVALADLGRRLAESLRVSRYGRKVKADLCARAWTELANAHRVADDFDASEEAFGHARAWADQGTGSPSLLARMKELIAALLREQRRLGMAAELLDGVADYYREEGDGEALVRILLSRALIFEEENEPERALGTVLEAMEYLEWYSPLRLPLLNILVDNLVGAGLCGLARGILRQTRRLYRRTGKLNDYRLSWLEGRIAAGLGENGVAEAKFNTARLGFEHASKHYDSARVGLDLALLMVRQERRQETVWLVNDMLKTFRAKGIAREVLSALALLKRSCERRRSVEVLAIQIESIAATVIELQRQRPRQARLAGSAA
jgi:hypothetical protein